MIETLSALLTPTVAAVAIVIAFMQWRTAHQKVVLDLFERRLAVVESARNAAKALIFEKDVEKAAELATDVAIRSRFLFGRDIVKVLAEFRGDVYRATEIGGLRESTSDVERLSIAKAAARAVLRDLSTMAEPYMRMDQRLIRTPAEWLRDRNRARLSYADEHQR
ncbi:hypothetical protein [Sinorhizobium meliloti]|uniref:hypothetical protein n=1 Tax=Rhizobium meliloti TaxID=382 RepID=UPI000FDA4C89|nr:hypothetical protein [Sinorhizobium meliloti]RVL63359.1 hypothetical protein CN137_12400 [Sinorhizobium meliloti]